MAKGNEGNKKLQIIFSPLDQARLARLQEATDAASHAEVIRRALRLYERLHEVQQAGGAVQFVQGDKVEKVEFVF